MGVIIKKTNREFERSIIMLKKNIKYVDFNGVERSEDFYFNLTTADLTEMQLGVSGGLTGLVAQITNTQDGPEIMRIFKDIILNSYGMKSLDGKRFIKTPQLSEEFSQTEAYSQLFMELATNDKAAAAFINGIVPANISTELAKQEALENKENIMAFDTDQQ